MPAEIKQLLQSNDIKTKLQHWVCRLPAGSGLWVMFLVDSGVRRHDWKDDQSFTRDEINPPDVVKY